MLFLQSSFHFLPSYPPRSFFPPFLTLFLSFYLRVLTFSSQFLVLPLFCLLVILLSTIFPFFNLDYPSTCSFASASLLSFLPPHSKISHSSPPPPVHYLSANVYFLLHSGVRILYLPTSFLIRSYSSLYFWCIPLCDSENTHQLFGVQTHNPYLHCSSSEKHSLKHGY